MRLSELRGAMTDYATQLDPALVSAQDAARMLDDIAAIRNIAATVEALLAARVAETEIWKRDGDRSAAHQLARTTGTSVGAGEGDPCCRATSPGPARDRRRSSPR